MVAMYRLFQSNDLPRDMEKGMIAHRAGVMGVVQNGSGQPKTLMALDAGSNGGQSGDDMSLGRRRRFAARLFA